MINQNSEQFNFINLVESLHERFWSDLFGNEYYLYHYTNLEGLIGILKLNGFWASHIKFMNDSKEFNHGLNLCDNIIGNLINSGTLNELQVKVLNDIYSLIHRDDHSSFVISFCPDGDLLSQWRGYSGGRGGVSIGFRRMEFGEYRTLREKETAVPQKVIYNPQIQSQIITDILNYALSFYSDENNSQMNDHFNILSSISTLLKHYNATFKDNSFREENEWGIIITNYSVPDAHDVKFRVKENILLPYLELQLKDKLTNQNRILPIDHIIVGPSNDSKFTYESLQYFLQKSNLGHIKLINSEIPFR